MKSHGTPRSRARRARIDACAPCTCATTLLRATPTAPGPSGCSAAGGGASRRRARTATRRSAPLVSVLLFLAAIVSAFWYLRNEEFEREQEAVRRDTEVAQQQMRLRLIENHEQLMRMARELVSRDARPRRLPRPGGALHARAPRDQQPDLARRPARSRSASYSGTSFPPETGISGIDDAGVAADRAIGQPRREAAFSAARETRQTGVLAAVRRQLRQRRCSRPQIPLLDHGVFDGALIAEYSIERLLRYFVPTESRAATRSRVLDERRARRSPAR